MAFKPKPEPRLPRRDAGSAGRSTTRVSFSTQNTEGLPEVILSPPAAIMMRYRYDDVHEGEIWGIPGSRCCSCYGHRSVTAENGTGEARELRMSL